jgi:hypothetical protein
MNDKLINAIRKPSDIINYLRNNDFYHYVINSIIKEYTRLSSIKEEEMTFTNLTDMCEWVLEEQKVQDTFYTGLPIPGLCYTHELHSIFKHYRNSIKAHCYSHDITIEELIHSCSLDTTDLFCDGLENEIKIVCYCIIDLMYVILEIVEALPDNIKNSKNKYVSKKVIHKRDYNPKNDEESGSETESVNLSDSAKFVF